VGSGILVFEDDYLINGKLSFAENDRINFGYRDFVFYRRPFHKGKFYSGFFVNAADEGVRFAIMRAVD
jgi:hypothetical protein